MPERRVFHLVGSSGPIELVPGEQVLGRSRGCEIVLDDPSVSRRHAVLLLAEKGRVTVRDLGSSNGTFVNGRELEGEVPLVVGDELTLGETRLLLRADPEVDAVDLVAEPEEPPAAPAEASCPKCGAAVTFTASRCPACGMALAGDLSEKPTAQGAGMALPIPRPRQEAVSMTWTVAEAGDGGEPAPTTVIEPGGEAAGFGGHGDAGGDELLPSIEDLGAPADGGAAPTTAVPARRGPADRPSAPAPRTASRSSPAPPAAAPALPAAGFGPRLAASVVDGLLLFVVCLGASFLTGGPASRGGGTVGAALLFALGILVPVFGWSIWGTTPGKRLFGLYVCELGGGIGLGVGRAVLRFLGYAVSLLPLGAGFLMVMFSASRRGLHDLISGTYVGRLP